MHFNGEISASIGSGDEFILYDIKGTCLKHPYRMNFYWTNNIIEYEGLLLGIIKERELGININIWFFGNLELIIH